MVRYFETLIETKFRTVFLGMLSYVYSDRYDSNVLEKSAAFLSLRWMDDGNSKFLEMFFIPNYIVSHF